MSNAFSDTRLRKRTVCELDINSDMQDMDPGEFCNDSSENSNFTYSKDTSFNRRNAKSSAFSIDNILNRKDDAQIDSAPKSKSHSNTQITSLAMRK